MMDAITQPIRDFKSEPVASREIKGMVRADLPQSPSMLISLKSIIKNGNASNNLKLQLSLEEIRLLTSQITNAVKGEPGNLAQPKTLSLEFSFSDSTGDLQIFRIDRMLFKHTPQGWLSWDLPTEVITYWRLRF